MFYIKITIIYLFFKQQRDLAQILKYESEQSTRKPPRTFKNAVEVYQLLQQMQIG